MTDPTPEIVAAFDRARQIERDVRDASISDELDQADRLATSIDSAAIESS